MVDTMAASDLGIVLFVLNNGQVSSWLARTMKAWEDASGWSSWLAADPLCRTSSALVVQTCMLLMLLVQHEQRDEFGDRLLVDTRKLRMV